VPRQPSPAAQTAVTLPPPRPQAASRYRPPELLRDLRLLDALALTGSSEQAGRWLAISQPTVSRRYRRLAADFGLGQRLRQARCSPLGASLSLSQLRLGARWHRFEAGVAMLGTDPLHQGLLDGLHGLLAVPHRFRRCQDWLALVQAGVIDAALVSSLELELELELEPDPEPEPVPQPPAGTGPAPQAPAPVPDPWPPVAKAVRLPLGPWPLRLATVGEASTTPRLLVPPAQLAPGLRTLLAGCATPLVACAPAGLHSLHAWRQQMAAEGLAAPIPEPLLRRDRGPLAGLRPLERASNLQEQLWLLLPHDWPAIPVLCQAVDALRQLAIASAPLG
jgi:hypothetical protein